MHMGMSDRAEPDASAIRIDDGDRLVLCTDGLTTMISEDAIARLLMEYAEPSAAAQALVDAANDAGGKDNTTVVVVQAGASIPAIDAQTATDAPISARGLDDGVGLDGTTVRIDSDIPERDIDLHGPFRA
jgi:protein phosphatase